VISIIFTFSRYKFKRFSAAIFPEENLYNSILINVKNRSFSAFNIISKALELINVRLPSTEK
jgi:hypothetical protein